jgi:beta-glucosidase/6-phospho-beta-glucosidase/beta-galactosidase
MLHNVHMLLQVPQPKLDNATFADAARGKVGIALNIEYLEPLTSAAEDVAAANYGLEKNLGWFADPLFFGECTHPMHSA